MRFVLDNSVVMRWLFRDGTSEAIAYADRVLGLMAQEDTLAQVPCIWAQEVGNVIVRAEAKGLLLAWILHKEGEKRDKHLIQLELSRNQFVKNAYRFSPCC